MRIAVQLTSLGLLAILGGCASLNPFASKPAPKNPPAALQDFKQTANVRPLWSTSVGSAGTFSFTPAITNGSVYAAAADGTIVRLDAESGRTVWRINAGAPLTAGVGSDGSTVAVSAPEGVLMAFDGDGKLRWKAQASSEVLSAPAVGQGLVVVRSVDNRVEAFDVNSGQRRWVVQRTLPPLTLRTAPGITLAEQTGFVALPGGRLAALALTNGGPRWEVAVGDPRGTTELERIADLSGTPVLSGGDVCAVAYQGRIACFNAATGVARWAKEFSSHVGVSADERFVYGADDKGIVTAFTKGTGSGAWRNNKLANRGLSSPVPVGNIVAVGDAMGYIHFLSREDGSLAARTNTDGSQVIAALPLNEGKSAIFQTQAGTVAALAAE